jgi:curli biogenesis system outer membrane secretion channel CsgG
MKSTNGGMRRTQIALVISFGISLTACVSSEALRQDVVKNTAEVTKGPSTAPYRSVTNFSSAVRCMDGMLITYGVRDISILVEDLEDQTKKVSTGTKDMLLTTMSDMTRRSRAIKFIAYGGDSKNAVAFLQQAEKKDAYSSVPQFDIRGSVTQFEDNIAKAAKDVGFSIGEFLNLGKSSSSTAKIVALDLAILNTSDFSLVPGVVSKNAVALFSQSDASDLEAKYKKLGVNYTASLSKNDGTAIAMRNLVELASVELIGKLTKVPYWKCLGASPEDETVKTEVEDWFESMTTNPAELFAYFQYQMSIRGTYDGAVNGVPTPALSRALKEYKTAMGIPSNSDLNPDFLAAYLNADHKVAMAALEAAREKAKVNFVPITATMQGSAALFRPGEKVSVTLASNTASHAHCFMQDDNKAILRVMPNRFARDSYLDETKPIVIPGDRAKFSLTANNRGVEEIVECYVAHKDYLNEIPEAMRSSDLEPLKGVRSLDEIRTAFEKVSKSPISVARFAIKTRR